MDREAFDRKYAARLNRQQQEAVHAVEGPVLLLAVPGSGKTTVLVTRLGYMLCCCGIAPDQILTMTYTRAAAGEMKQRFAALFGQDCPHPPEIRTINGVSSKIIAYYAQNCGKRPPFILAEDESALAKLVSDLYRDLCGEYPTQSVVKELRKSIAYAKNMMLPEERLGGKAFGSTKSGIAPFYSDKYAKTGIQVCDLYDEDRLRDRLERAVDVKNVLFEHLYHKPKLDDQRPDRFRPPLPGAGRPDDRPGAQGRAGGQGHPAGGPAGLHEGPGPGYLPHDHLLPHLGGLWLRGRRCAPHCH